MVARCDPKFLQRTLHACNVVWKSHGLYIIFVGNLWLKNENQVLLFLNERPCCLQRCAWAWHGQITPTGHITLAVRWAVIRYSIMHVIRWLGAHTVLTCMSITPLNNNKYSGMKQGIKSTCMPMQFWASPRVHPPPKSHKSFNTTTWKGSLRIRIQSKNITV